MSGIRGNPSRKERVIVMSPHQAADSRTDRDEEVSERDPFLWLPFFDRYSRREVTAASGSYAGHTRAYVERTRDVRRRTENVRRRMGNVRRAYAGRTQHTASTRTCGFLGGFGRLFEDFLVSSDSRIVRESPPVPRLAQPGWKPSPSGLSEGWVHNFSELCPHQMAPKFALNFQALHYESGSSGTTSSAAPLGQPFVLN